MNKLSQHHHNKSSTYNWRQHPGYLSEGGSDFESVHILLGRFLSDRHSENPLSENSLLAENGTFEWGLGRPLEKVINSQEDLEFLLKNLLYAGMQE